MSFMNNIIAKRLGGSSFGDESEVFKFEKIKRAKSEAKALNPNLELIDLGVGEPDRGAGKDVVDILAEEAMRLENRKYADNGILEFKEAAIDYMKKVYNVNNLNVDRNVVHGIGSKSILSMIPTCVINPGDVALVTVPGYPILATHVEYLGGEVYSLPLKEENDYLPDLDNIPEEVLRRSKVLYINYPNNPTGAVATKEFFEKVVAFTKKNKILVVHDAAYAAITYDGYKPLSFLSVEGAIDVGVEVHSLSKAFNMTGWRLAFVVGNEEMIDVIKKVKDNCDSGQFRAIQKAGVYALNHIEITDDICRRYSYRMDKLINILNKVGFDAKKSRGTFYCYVKSPKGARNVKFTSAENAADYLIENSLISVVPWDDVGCYLRFSVTFESDNDEEVFKEIEKRLIDLELSF